MRKLKSIISVFLAVAIAAVSFVPAYAVDPSVILNGAAVAPSFFDWAIGSLISLSNFGFSFFDPDVCEGAGPNMNGRHVYEEQLTTVNDMLGVYYVCKNCGKAAGEVSKPAYEEEVSKLPAQGYNSDGSLYVTLSHYYTDVLFWDPARYVYCEHSDNVSEDVTVSYRFNCADNSILAYPLVGSSSFKVPVFYFYFGFTVPIDGYYTPLDGPAFSFSYDDVSGNRTILSASYSAFSGVAQSPGCRSFYSVGKFVQHLARSNFLGSDLPSGNISYMSVVAYPPTYKVEPLESVSGTDGTYSQDTRPTTITGDYAIVDNQGQVTIIKDSTIVNETTNNYYNPATGQQQPITDWSYDYPSRTYTVTTDSNNTVTITYGDEHVVINEGDTIYNIYYAMDDVGGDKPACEHDWQAGDKTDPTCTQAGKRMYSCSKCGEAKSESIPALGHDWQVLQSVTTKYNDSGQLLQEGYTIYECSRCKEQYKTASGVSPPPSGGGGSGGTDTPGGDASIWDKLGELIGGTVSGISGLLGSVVGKLLDALIALGKTILDGLTAVVGTILAIFEELPQLFSGFVTFLAAVFPFLPDEMITLLTFGLAAVVFVGIIKAVRR